MLVHELNKVSPIYFPRGELAEELKRETDKLYVTLKIGFLLKHPLYNG